VQSERPKRFTLKIRIPEWTDGITVTVNGEPQTATPDSDGFAVIDRKWSNNDLVDVELPMHLNWETLPDRSAFRAVTYGPLVLASRDGSEELTGLFADDSRMGHVAHGPKVPAIDFFTIAAEGTEVEELIKTGDTPLRFIMQTSRGAVELEPFYGIHESRYTIYFPTEYTVVNEADEALSAATIDVVYGGQQQPETEHDFASQRSTNGYSHERQWRETGGWFSYRLQNPQNEGKRLSIVYLNTHEARDFTVEIEGNAAQTIATNGNATGQWESTEIELPAGIANEFEVKIASTGRGRTTPPIAEIRLLKTM
jgi:hypothetical protein